MVFYEKTIGRFAHGKPIVEDFDYFINNIYHTRSNMIHGDVELSQLFEAATTCIQAMKYILLYSDGLFKNAKTLTVTIHTGEHNDVKVHYTTKGGYDLMIVYNPVVQANWQVEGFTILEKIPYRGGWKVLQSYNNPDTKMVYYDMVFPAPSDLVGEFYEKSGLKDSNYTFIN